VNLHAILLPSINFVLAGQPEPVDDIGLCVALQNRELAVFLGRAELRDNAPLKETPNDRKDRV
jgi:hypothetical protein